MPVHKVKGGYKWGKTGKTYPTKKQANKQARAIYANGYKNISEFKNMNNNNIFKITESELKHVIIESVKRILKENFYSTDREIEIDAEDIFDPEMGHITYPESLLNSNNPKVKEAAKYMLDIIHNADYRLEPFCFYLSGEIGSDKTGPYTGNSEWMSTNVEITHYPPEIEELPSSIKEMILKLAEEYVNENDNLWNMRDFD